MLRPKLNILDDQLVRQVIDEALQLLVDPGVRVHNEEALRLLSEGGARVDTERQVAYIPEHLVWDALSTTPKGFHLYDLKGEQAVRYGGG